MPERSRPAARRVQVEARAKINLGLIVGPQRADGFHDLATVFQSVSLSDSLRIEPRRRDFSLEVHHQEAAVRGRTHWPPDRAWRGSRNIVLEAARLLVDRAGLRGGAHFHLIKRIPLRSGLGGGSADAGAAILGLDRLYDLRLSKRRRLELALEIGSDVPFAMVGGTALGLGRGELLTRIRLKRPFRAVIATPSWRISTAQAYARIDRHKYDLTAWRAKLRSAQALERKQISTEDAMRLGNSFEQVLGTRRSDLLSLFARLRAAGAAEVRMTGSGSSVFGVLRPELATHRVVGRLAGSEAFYVVRSTQTGLRLTTLP